MERYDSYKDSGVEWIGDIPTSWSSLKIKRTTNIKRGSSPRPIDDPKYFDDEKGEYHWIRISDVSKSGRYLTHTEQKLSELGSSLSHKLNEDEIVMSISGSVGKVFITKTKCCIHDGFVTFENPKVERDFLYYLLTNDELYNEDRRLGTQFNINSEIVGNKYIPFPPLSEQQEIVSFLDTKTSLIDSLIEKTQRKIELLKEKRTSLINEVVTKGLNPDVDMKDSGVEWIGEIPIHWELKQLKHISDFQNGYGFKSDKWTDSGIPIIRIQNLNGGENFNFYEEENELEKYLVFEGDLLFSWSGNVGTSFGPFMWDKKGRYYLNQHIFLFNQKVEVNLKWYFFTLKRLTRFIEEYFTSGVIGLVHITKDELGGSKIPYPPLNEQQQIVEYLDEQTQLIDKTISIEEKRIELLKEYRQSLISEVVTGKRKVVE